MTLMRVKTLSRTAGARQAALVLEDVAGRLALAFLIPMNGANRVARVLGLTGCHCAPVYELIVDLMTHGALSVARVVLDCEADGIYAKLVLDRDGVPTALRCHPADAVALALRTRAPICATTAALDHACALGDGHHHRPDPASLHSPDASSSALVQWLEDVRPDDFGPHKRL